MKIVSRARRLALAATLPLALAACAGGSSRPGDTAYVARDVETLYAAAKERLDTGQPKLAAALFDEVERQHPYSPWATRAQLMSGFAHYEATDYDDAVIAFDRFIQLHPADEEVGYAYYLKALSYYERISDVERDQGITETAMSALNDVVQRFPGTDYARDSALKLDLTRDQLAGKEMAIGRWYLRQEQYNAAIGRFRNVVDNYQTTTHVPEALHRLIEAYLSLGLVEEARATAAVLGYNYPGSDWYLDSYALLVDEGVRPPDDRSFLTRAIDAVL